MDFAELSEVMEFITKIGQIVLRARVGIAENTDGTNSNINAMSDFINLLDHPEFWKSGMPINIDVFLSKTRTLVERWVVSFEQSERMHNADTTDLILMVQSLYSHIRLMPIHVHLGDGILKKSDLQHCIVTADGFSLSSYDNFGSGPISTLSAGFDLRAKLKVHKFRTAVASFGLLHLSVMYDSNTSSFVSNTAITQQVIPVSLSESTEACNPIVVTKSNPLTTPLRSSTGSPFPSPTFTKKVLNFAHSRTSLEGLPTENVRSKLMSSFGIVEDPTIDYESRTQMANDIPSIASNIGNAVPLTIPKPLSPGLAVNIPISNFLRHSPQKPTPFPSSNSLSPMKLSRSSYGEFYSHNSVSSRKRESFNSELFGSLVGSYEESILSGRMSTLPSKPIVFIAEIGVIGFGKCKPHLKCPPHVNLNFPAYFYELEDDQNFATPYVGSIDLETISGYMIVGEPSNSDIHSNEYENEMSNRRLKEEEYRKNWPGGYRLPFRGQLQIIIKNPSKTAIKVFLVPYDMKDMPANSKTFLRQKSYSTPTTPKTNNSPQRNVNFMNIEAKSPQNDRLRYAIHLQFICNNKKRLFLSKNIRVVFSSRAPDSDEKLRTVCEGPKDPKYSNIVESLPSVSGLPSISASSYFFSTRRQSPLWNSDNVVEFQDHIQAETHSVWTMQDPRFKQQHDWFMSSLGERKDFDDTNVFERTATPIH
ncbi:hypothetical protein HK096_002441 [Nowakowskiella sp. JEL0078]|nr:hypothetical protein HK096_002441 [Nowakowskiella sp. JEL0078]